MKTTITWSRAATSLLASLLLAAAAQAAPPGGPATAPAVREGTRASAPSPRQGRTGEPAESDAADQVVWQSLAQIQPNFGFQASKFEEVIDLFRQVCGINIVVNWAALEAAGVDKNTQVTISLANVTRRKALEEILASVPTVAPLGFSIDEGVLHISTRDELSRKVVVRVYDVSDLLQLAPDGPVVPEPMGSTGGQIGGLGGEVGQRPAGPPAGMGSFAPGHYRSGLLDVVRSVIDPPSWRENGGTSAIEVFDGIMVVTQTPENHEKLESLLDKMRAVRRQRPPTPAQRMQQSGQAVRMVENMKQASFQPEMVGLIAVAGLREDVSRPAEQVIADLEGLLAKTETIGLRNAIRLTLRDLYRQVGNNEKVLEHLRAMLQENDKAARQGPAPMPPPGAGMGGGPMMGPGSGMMGGERAPAPPR